MTRPIALELLAPAKNADIGIEAILHGADAVYIGGPQFGAREEAANTFTDIARLCDFAHRFNTRVYMTLNTLIADHEMAEAVSIAWEAYRAGVDALIVQDLGLLEEKLPPIQLHASTQCDTRSPMKARFLEQVGFSQIVLARETDLEGIREAKAALQRARIEYFIHGALCVSYSGQCYASFATVGRSANRGACAQLCRLPYNVYTEDGKELAHERHVLSLKDNNQSGNIEALIEAGVTSFKIEGRLKDIDYVKNITAHYRAILDDFIAKHTGYTRTSVGESTLSFTPKPEKSFNRGFTDYFTRERHHDMAVFETPKNTGERIATIVRVTNDFIEVKAMDELHNADGLTYLTREKTLAGFMVNTAEELAPGRFRLTLRDRQILRKHPQLAPGMTLYRNRDKAWEDILAKPTATRTIALDVHWKATDDSFAITLTDVEGIHVTVTDKPETIQKTERIEQNRQNLEKNLSKFGGTDFRASAITLEGVEYFAPAGFVNALRRTAVEALVQARARAFEKLQPAPRTTPAIPYPDAADFRANVINEQAVHFYKKCGTEIIEPALETGDVKREVPLMVTKHCIRYALGLCLKDNIDKIKTDPGLKEMYRPDPFILQTGPHRFKATFDCKKCEMTLTGRVKTSASLGHVRSLK